MNSFTNYYNFHFAKLDCVAFGTACSDKKVESFPTIMLFKDGKEVKRTIGTQSMKQLSKWVEETLEVIRPGSRPVEGPVLPIVGANSVKGFKKESEGKIRSKVVEQGRW